MFVVRGSTAGRRRISGRRYAGDGPDGPVTDSVRWFRPLVTVGFTESCLSSIKSKKESTEARKILGISETADKYTDPGGFHSIKIHLLVYHHHDSQ